MTRITSSQLVIPASALSRPAWRRVCRWPQLLDQSDLILAAVDGGADAVVNQQQFMNTGASAIADEITLRTAFGLPQPRADRDRHLPGGVGIRLPG